MPWEKSFDEDEAVETAMNIFWEKGYDSTSLSDLIDGTGINRGSLYNAFGGKHELFVRALTKYVEENHRATLARLEALDDPKRAFRTLFDGLVKETKGESGKRGCFLVNTALVLSSQEPEVQALVTRALAEAEAFFRRGIEVGQVRGEVSTALEPAGTAKALLGLLVAIRVLGRGVYGEKDLRGLADQALHLIE